MISRPGEDWTSKGPIRKNVETLAFPPLALLPPALIADSTPRYLYNGLELGMSLSGLFDCII